MAGKYIPDMKKCPDCYGLGIVPDSFPDQDCETCEGMGEVEETQKRTKTALTYEEIAMKLNAD